MPAGNPSSAEGNPPPNFGQRPSHYGQGCARVYHKQGATGQDTTTSTTHRQAASNTVCAKTGGQGRPWPCPAAILVWMLAAEVLCCAVQQPTAHAARRTGGSSSSSNMPALASACV
jgi:hypothetical protein